MVPSGVSSVTPSVLIVTLSVRLSRWDMSSRKMSRNTIATTAITIHFVDMLDSLIFNSFTTESFSASSPPEKGPA